MTNHFISNIEITHYKCFRNFSSTGFKRINLVGGMNNVGKTAFMEALFINACSTDVSEMMAAVAATKFMRENINLIFEQDTYKHRKDFFESIIKLDIASNLRQVSFSVQMDGAVKNYLFDLNGTSYHYNANEVVFDVSHNDSVEFIDNFGWADFELIQAYNAIQRKNQEAELNQFIHEFDPNVENFKVIAGKPQCGIKSEIDDSYIYRDIVEFGDGLKHYISIICALHSSENGYLFIDEIDNGIHYSQLDRLWQLIFDLSKTTNCQVFATTHSKEMLESFARVAKKNQEHEISYTTLVHDRERKIRSLLLDYDGLMSSLLDQGHEIR